MTAHRHSPTSSGGEQRPILNPSKLGKFIQYDACPRQLLFELQDTEETIRTLGYNRQELPEVFGGGGVVERAAGNAFENTVMDTMTSKAEAAYDFETATLQTIAETMPDVVQDTLPHGDTVTEQDIKSGSFRYCNVPSTDIVISDVDTVVDADTFTLPVTRDKSAVNSDTDVTNRIKSAFFELRERYTTRVLEAVLPDEIATVPPDANTVTPPRVDAPTQDSLVTVEEASGPVLLYQPTFSGTIGAWSFAGHADVVVLWPPTPPSRPQPQQQGQLQLPTAQLNTTGGDVTARVLDVKLATEEQTHHQIQTTVYAELLDRLFNEEEDEFSGDMACLAIETGVITQDAAISPLNQDVLPSFDRESRVADIKNLVQTDGVLDSIRVQSITDVPYQLNSKCASCKYNEACYTDTVESEGLELLGIDNGTIAVLKNHGISSLTDLAKLAAPVDEYTHPKLEDQPGKNPSYTDVYNDLLSVPSVGTELPALIQRAQGLLQKINPEHSRVSPTQNATHITNTGYGELPTTVGADEQDAVAYGEGSLIRVYVNVQHDHVRDHIVALSFHACAGDTSVTETWSDIDTTLSDDPVTAHEREFALLDSFTDAVGDAVQTIADEISYPSHQDNPFIHFFTYTESEQVLLTERLNLYADGDVGRRITEHKYPRQENVTAPAPQGLPLFDISESFLNVLALLSMRDGAEQQMCSAVLPDIEERMALQTPTTGLINIYDQFYPEQDTDRFRQSDWMLPASETPSVVDAVDLTSVFDYRFFNNGAYYTRDDAGVTLSIGSSQLPTDSVDGWYPYRVRSGAQIPLAYIWGVTDRLSTQTIDALDERKVVIRPFTSYTADNTTHQIMPVYITGLLERLTKCLRHVERGVPHKSRIYYDGTHGDQQ